MRLISFEDVAVGVANLGPITKLHTLFNEMDKRRNAMGGHSIARHYGAGLTFENLKFKKTGSEINRAIDDRTGILNAEIAKSQEVITKICKDRQIDTDEIFSADDEEKIAAYSTRLENNAPRAQGAMAEFQRDLSTLKTQSALIVRKKVLIDELTRVKKNIDQKESFSLSYDEICDLGF